MDENTLRKQINASGFPFQLRVENEVRASQQTHGWHPIAGEHQWVNPGSGAGGFIDLILRREIDPWTSWYMVIECKRTRGGRWVFLSQAECRERNDAHALLTLRQPDESVSSVWVREKFMPATRVSSFCAVPGQADKQTPMLERISAELLDSLESLAEEELAMGRKPPQGDRAVRAVYMPVVVTNTQLVACQFEPAEVNLQEGVLEDSSGQFESVPFIRFQKSLATRFATNKVPMNLKEANTESQRTILVVHAPSLPHFLGLWRVS